MVGYSYKEFNVMVRNKVTAGVFYVEGPVAPGLG